MAVQAQVKERPERVFTGRIDPDKIEALADPDANIPQINRAIAGLYAPGSTFKVVTASAAWPSGPGARTGCSCTRAGSSTSATATIARRSSPPSARAGTGEWSSSRSSQTR